MRYYFAFQAEWVGFGKNANWQHVLQIAKDHAGAMDLTLGQQQMAW